MWHDRPTRRPFCCVVPRSSSVSHCSCTGSPASSCWGLGRRRAMAEAKLTADQAHQDLDGQAFDSTAIAVVINQPGSDDPRPYHVNLSDALRNIFEQTAVDWIH